MLEVVDNIVSKLCDLVLAGNPEGGTPLEWRLLGQEQDGALLFSWVQTSCTYIGLYSSSDNSLKTLHTFDGKFYIVQASVNFNKTILAYVIKEMSSESAAWNYTPFIINLQNNGRTLSDFNIMRNSQIMVQFLHRNQPNFKKQLIEKLLLLVHHDCILQYELHRNAQDCEMHVSCTLVKEFSWAQWDSSAQTLYYIHYRKPATSLVEGEENNVSATESSTPTLSALQFHDDLPHETLMNIPLNRHYSSEVCSDYEDDTVPLRIHDSSLDLIVLTSLKGQLYVCHHYLYQPANISNKDEDNSSVYLTYSVTVLHQSYVVQCVISELSWSKAKSIRPNFILYGDHHMLVIIPSICIQLLDLGTLHEPMCHITFSHDSIDYEPQEFNLVSLLGFPGKIALNLHSLELIDVSLSKSLILQSFKECNSVEHRLAILHYLLIHLVDMAATRELLLFQATTGFSDFPFLLREFLIGGCFSTLYLKSAKNTNKFLNLLPISTLSNNKNIIRNVKDMQIVISHDILWNASLMLLSPQQRLVPYRVDTWVKLSDYLMEASKRKQRFKSSTVLEKLSVSLTCFQSDTLSRSTTPMSSSATGHPNHFSINDCCIIFNSATPADLFPFTEIENCTLSKQEHIISVNLRELSMHLLKQTTGKTLGSLYNQFQTSVFVHGFASRYVACQLETSRYLCHVLCKLVMGDLFLHQEKGFAYIDLLSMEKRWILFTILEKYYSAAEVNAFPLPLGFSSFFTYLGYCSLSFDMFLHYLHQNVFEVHADVMKLIIKGTRNTSKLLKLCTLLPRSRTKDLLEQYNHPYISIIKAREHTCNILSGIETFNADVQRMHEGKLHSLGLAGGERLPPLNTFLDLLTAKANLNELNFELLTEATIKSFDDNFNLNTLNW